ncbi:Phosphate regulon sensor protein PhoR (SphS) [Sulfitobacter noctilucicola]|uniref:histidine kinase n=1 Tax=Sulfitobacter noctilucicola TaxID=1342301 RepID=A0A7W6M7E8_9RHOB|nr:ATP-binding protein [Sulfitobacter noctilucicola]KIN65012.1 Phosphate regulon sensor protein PhoR (SphS) [Sulfitobacter noctilucicola]MBB4173848.1 two-component system phosphate regulon sensor histidine kinase PhoR [Sulfitobacter noctilucicola]
MADRGILNDVLAALPLPALAINRHERIVAINAQAEGLLGKGAVDRHFVTVLRQPTLVEAVEGLLEDGKPRSVPYLGGDPVRPLTYQVTLRAIGTGSSLIASFEDMTHAAQAGQMRRDFVANVSHELRTPLTSLMGFIETLSGPARDDAKARDRFLQIMAGETERMNRLVGDLLSLSRVEADERVRPTTPVNLRDILQSTLRNLNPLAVDRDVLLRPSFGEDRITLTADADQLLQVFTNLIENAIKYGAPGKFVDIGAETSLHDPAMRGPAVRVTVRDYGNGIAPEHLPRLTERFYRADSHRSRALGGTGLGLAIVKHILNRHRGRLKIASTVGEGAEFTVILPMDSEAAPADRAEKLA